MKVCHVLSLVLVLTLASSAVAADWPQFRGPFFNGSTDEKSLPVGFEATENGENIVWIADLPGPSASTPAVWGDHIFVSSTDTEADSLHALCVDRGTGKIRWKKDISKGTHRDERSTFAAPSPATDGNIVVFFYGNGELVAYDFSGKQVWNRNIQKDYGDFAFLWTFSTSPVLYDGKLYMQVLQRDEPVRRRRGRRGGGGSGAGGSQGGKIDSYLLALDPKSGKELWRHVRPSKARAESLEAFTTPTPYESKGRKSLLIAGGDALTAHDVGSGKELWRWGTWNPEREGHWRLVPSPVAGSDIALACAPKGGPVYAIKTDGKGTLGDGDIAWVSRKTEVREVSSDVPTPTYYDGDFFVLNDKKWLSRVEPKTGKLKWQIRAPGSSKYEASPLAADGKIYLINFAGEVAAVDAKNGDVLKITETNPNDEADIRSSVIAARGQLFVRTNRKLYCVAKK